MILEFFRKMQDNNWGFFKDYLFEGLEGIIAGFKRCSVKDHSGNNLGFTKKYF